jgi:predicted N-acetyltransferase YhbS
VTFALYTEMPQHGSGQSQVETALVHIELPAGISIRAWTEIDFPAIQRLSRDEEWTTPEARPEETLAVWRASWPALVAVEHDSVIGFVRALTDGAITLYVAELLVALAWRRRGVGCALLDTCHLLYPHTRIDLLSTESAERFYEAIGFRRFQGFRKSYL